MAAGEFARDYYLNDGQGSARSILLALRYTEILEFTDELLLAATAFNCGLPNCEEFCGCLAAARMAIGLRYGRDGNTSGECNRMMFEFADELAGTYGTIHCGDRNRKHDNCETITRRQYCARLVESVANRLSEILHGENVTIPSLRALIDVINKLPVEDRRSDKIRQLVQRTHISETEIEKCMVFSNEGYARNLFYKNTDFEVLVMCWKSGQKSPIHDHDNCLSIEKVFSGHLAFTTYHRVDENSDEIYQGETYTGVPGDVADVAAGAIHLLDNPHEFGSDAITVHFYFPPLKRMKCFNIENKTADWRKLGYLYIYNPDAWQSLNSCGI
jgi:cysteine dioxygenase